MSWQAAEWMDGLPYDLMKPLATRVLLKLANVAAQDGTRAYRNIWEVARELGVDRKSVQRALRQLEEADLIRKAKNQLAVSDIPANRRPTVYDLNFGYARMYAQPELPLPEGDDGPDEPAETVPEDVPNLGATELSTGSSGATLGATSSVPLGTNRTSLTTEIKETYVPNRAYASQPADCLTFGHKRGTDNTCTRCGRPLVVLDVAGWIGAGS